MGISDEDRAIFYRSLNIISENIVKLQSLMKEKKAWLDLPNKLLHVFLR